MVLGLLREAGRPVGAYDISEMARRAGESLVPNQVYRTVARLIDQRAVRRIETLNAYIPSRAPADLCLICTQCHGVELVELPSLDPLLAKAVDGTGFHPSVHVLEMLGRCARCQAARIKGPPAQRHDVQ